MHAQQYVSYGALNEPPLNTLAKLYTCRKPFVLRELAMKSNYRLEKQTVVKGSFFLSLSLSFSFYFL